MPVCCVDSIKHSIIHICDDDIAIHIQNCDDVCVGITYYTAIDIAINSERER